MSSSSKINLESTYTNSIDAEYCLDEDWFKFTTTSNDAFYRITYKNLNEVEVKLYYYVEKGEILGSISDKLYINFEKDGKYLSYEKYL